MQYKKHLNKKLAHLSHSREGFCWPVPLMSIQPLEQLELFLSQLDPKKRSWFPPSQAIRDRKLQAATARQESYSNGNVEFDTTSTAVVTRSATQLYTGPIVSIPGQLEEVDSIERDPGWDSDPP